MTRKLLFSILAVISAALMPLAASSQIAPDKPVSQSTEPNYKNEAFVGWGYTSLNQVNQSRNGLQGVSFQYTRNLGKYFGITGEGGHYAWVITSANTGNPTVDMYLGGPIFHAPLYGRTSIFVHGLLGVVHTGNVSISPDKSFAGGLGIGVDYGLRPRLALRLYGDDIGSAFTVVPFEPGDSPHTRFNARASLGVVYKF